MLERNQIGFPNMYAYFHIEEYVRADREMKRSTLLGKSSEEIAQKVVRYRDFTTLQKEYFIELEQEFPGLVLFLESNNIKSSVETILSSTKELHYDDREIFTFIIDWCERQRKENN